MNQSGIATILAIGITALLLCLAIAFVTTSIVEKKAAANYQSMITARIAAQTAFNRAMSQMKDQSLDSQESYNEIVSHDPGVNNLSISSADSARYFQNLPTALTTTVNGYNVYSLDTSYPQGITFSDTSTVTWLYFVDTSASGDPKVASRIAYVIVPDKGKIDPWAIIDSGANAGACGKTSPSEVAYGGANSYTSVDGAGNYVVGRPGRDITELCLASLEYDGSDTFSPTYTQQMSVNTASPAGVVAVGQAGNWTDFESLCTTLSIPASQTAKRDYFRKVFYINSLADPEEFWIDSNADSIRNLSELTTRFDLVSAGGSIGGWNSIDTGAIANSIPWLGNWKYSGDFPSANSARNQIIANLITYCKTDTNAITDSPNAPTYVGLERCPYINEARIQVPISITRTTPPLPPSIYSWTVTIGNPLIAIELVDMHGVTLTGNALPRAIINLNLSYYIGLSGSENLVSTATITDSPLDVGYAPKGYASTPGSTSIPGYPYIFNLSLPTSNNLGVKIYLNSFTIGLQSRDALPSFSMYDFAYLQTTPTPAMQAYSGNAASYSGSYYIDYQTRDPRQNLLTTDWTLASGISSNGTLDAINSNYPTTFTGSDTDPEPNNTAPWNLSTAYIRKGPMKSPWELGFIHRAKAFQTLNLKKYNANPVFGYGFGPSAGGDTYSYGDANILDQIKMTANTSTKGKINVNSDNQSVLRTLFDNIKLGSNLKTNPDPGVIGSTGTATITPAVASTIADSIRTANGTQGSGMTPFFTRASIVNAIPYLSTTDLGLGYLRTTDTQQEELIGKFINLTKAESPNNYTIIAVGEAIRDLGGVTIYTPDGQTITTIKGQFNPNADEILASQKIMALIQLDPVTKKFTTLRMIYLSD